MKEALFIVLIIGLVSCTGRNSASIAYEKKIQEQCKKGDYQKCHMLGQDRLGQGKIEEALQYLKIACDNNPKKCGEYNDFTLSKAVTEREYVDAIDTYVKNCRRLETCWGYVSRIQRSENLSEKEKKRKIDQYNTWYESFRNELLDKKHYVSLQAVFVINALDYGLKPRCRFGEFLQRTLKSKFEKEIKAQSATEPSLFEKVQQAKKKKTNKS